MIVADTNVVSELMRPDAAPTVLRWARGLRPGESAITAVTVHEIEHGLNRLPTGARREALTQRWQQLLAVYAESTLGYDTSAARTSAAILAAKERAGRVMTLADAQIAGICLVHGAQLATRNVKDFTDIPGLTVIDPWQE